MGASYQISINLVKWFWRRFLKLTNHKQELPMAQYIQCIMFLAHLAKGKLSFCHRMASVVR
jgi:hypothetical protein